MSAAKAKNWCRARSSRSINRQRLCCHRSRRSRRWVAALLGANRRRFVQLLSVRTSRLMLRLPRHSATPAAARAPQASTAPAKPAAAPARPAENMSADADFRVDAGTRSAFRSISPSGDAFGECTIIAEPRCFPRARSSATAAPPTQTAAVAPQAAAPAPAASNAGSGSFVQVSSQRSEAEAQSAFRGLQAKFPTQLGSRDLLIHRADLGSKGTYYRAVVGPFANPAEAANCARASRPPAASA